VAARKPALTILLSPSRCNQSEVRGVKIKRWNARANVVFARLAQARLAQLGAREHQEPAGAMSLRLSEATLRACAFQISVLR
jgi:hypothetical protein